MKLSLNKFFSIPLLFVPIPIFLDLSNFTFFLYASDSMRIYSISPKIPVPLVFFLTFSFLLYLYSTLARRRKLIVPNFSRYYYFVFVFVPFLFIVLFLNSFGLIQALQLLIAFSLIYFFPIPAPVNSYFESMKSFIIGICLWLILHAFSAYVSNDFNLIDFDRHLDFGRFFGYRIYQSTVSYSATLGIYLVFLLDIFKRNLRFSLSSFAIFISIICCVFLMTISQARLAQLDLVVILILFTIIPSTNISIRSLLYSLRSIISLALSLLTGKIRRFVLFIIPFLAGFCLFFTNYMYRFSKGGGDRFELWSRAIETILSNSSLLLGGTGQLHSFAHNTFFSLLLGLGIIPFILLVFVALFGYFLTTPRVHINSDFRPSLFSSLSFLFILFSNSVFNSGFTQPLFSCTLVLAIYFSFSLSPNHNPQR